MTSEPEVLFDVRGSAGIITLNRPKALNSLTHAMVIAMKAKLDEWAETPDIACVVLRGAGERAFCAGGDIRALHDSGRAGTSYARDFWHDEYILNAAIKRFRKPYMSLIHGICMGGGLGVSVHGEYRVADPAAVFAMPETGIGFFPDVGGSWFLPRCHGRIGMYLGLTGTRLTAPDALYAGIATHLLPAEEWPQLIDALAAGDPLVEVISELTEEPPPDAPLADDREAIDALFEAPSVAGVLSNLDRDGGVWAQETAAMIRRKSPTSLRIVFREIRTGAGLSFGDCMRMEYRIACRMLEGHDFYEGVRAAIIEKDNAPRWRPSSLAEVTDETVDAYFAPLGEKELRL